MLRKAKEKIQSRFSQKHTDWSLVLISFAESSFLPIIADPFLVAVTLAKSQYWFRYTLIVTAASVAGGFFGYAFGAVFFDLIGVRLIEFYGLESAFQKTVTSFDKGAFLFTLLGAFTPIPYKIIAIVAGFLKINIFAFVTASVIGRFTRFVIVAYITKQFGRHALRAFNHKLGILTAALICSVICAYIVIVFM